MFFTKVQESYCYTKLCNYREEYNLLVTYQIFLCVAIKWIDNLQQIEQHQKIKNCLLSFIFNFTCSKFFALKEKHDSKQTNHPQGGQDVQDVPPSKGTGEGGGSPCKSKSLNFPLLLVKNITYCQIPHIGKIGIPNSFQISFNKNFACSLHSVILLWLI